MKGNYLITLDFLKAHKACQAGQREFERAFPNGGEYQAVLDRCADENRMDFAQWLMNICGPSDDVRTFDDDVDAPDKNIAFAGTLYFKKGANVKRILAGEGIKAGWDINAGLGIMAGGSINAGDSIKTDSSIRAGESIRAGLDIKADLGIMAGLDIMTDGSINTGLGINAGKGIKAGWNIKAGLGIEGEDIKAGEGYGIFAGLDVKVSDWPKYAIVTAQNKPANLMTGYWKSR